MCVCVFQYGVTAVLDEGYVRERKRNTQTETRRITRVLDGNSASLCSKRRQIESKKFVAAPRELKKNPLLAYTHVCSAHMAHLLGLEISEEPHLFWDKQKRLRAKSTCGGKCCFSVGRVED